MELNIAQLIFTHISLKNNDIPLFRGAIAGQFRQFDLLHNHDPETGKVIYRYPAVQFKVVNDTPIIYAIGDKAIEVFKPLFLELNNLNLHGRHLSIREKQLIIKKQKLEQTGEQIVYRFITPWIALNQENYKKYLAYTDKDQRKKLLSSILINNIISLAKYAGYTIPAEIQVKHDLKQREILLKKEILSGFTGIFKTNFELPQFIGLGKSTSHGFGVVDRVI